MPSRTNASTDLVHRIRTSANILSAAAEPFGGLFPSLLTLEGEPILDEPPKPIPGQRPGDRAFPGSNLMHDHSMLAAFKLLAEFENDPASAAVTERYLDRFAAICSHPATGLYPWGEHAYWHLLENRFGNSYGLAGRDWPLTHDHLLQAPVWLWEELWERDPEIVRRFGRGLDGHWREGEPEEFIRHALIDTPGPQPGREQRSCDFARHTGHYIHDWSFIYAKEAEPEFRDRIRRMLDYWWFRRHPSGLLYSETRSPESDENHYHRLIPGQGLSLAVSLLESADRIEQTDPPLASTMRERAEVYLDGFLSAPHDLENGLLALQVDDKTLEAKKYTAARGSRYGANIGAAAALLCLAASRFVDDPRILSLAVAVTNASRPEAFPTDVHVPAKDVGMILSLALEMYAQTGEERWLEEARQVADQILPIYFDRPLLRGASGVDYYESQLLPGYLAGALVRLGIYLSDPNHPPIPADFTNR